MKTIEERKHRRQVRRGKKGEEKGEGMGKGKEGEGDGRGEKRRGGEGRDAYFGKPSVSYPEQ